MFAQGATVRWAILYYFILIPTLRNNIVKAFVPSGARSAYNHKYRGLSIHSLLPPLGGCGVKDDMKKSAQHKAFLQSRLKVDLWVVSTPREELAIEQDTAEISMGE